MLNDMSGSPQDYDLAVKLPDAAALARATVLRLVGNTDLIGMRAIGICGSRDATGESIDRAHRLGLLAAELGFGVISGNARGVDEAAQRAALEAGGWTVAVLAEGLGGWKPRLTHRPLTTAENFLAVSKFSDSSRWTVGRAMDRNHLVIALSQALVVVQAGLKGGTWEAGNACLKAKKPLLVVRSSSPETDGNRELIRRGGIAVSTFNDLRRMLDELKHDPRAYVAQRQLV